jgi:predicted amidophosphoribosyltransferase
VPFQDGHYGYPYEGIYKKLLHDLKFNHRRDVLPFLRSLVPERLLEEYDLIIPVPAHWRRRIEHGCDPVRSLFQLKGGVVTRHRYTPAFHRLGKDERAKLIRGAFRVKQASRIAASRILIVDDIYTTGATYRELKRILLDYGADSVEGYFLTKA